jgi:chemotaxis protein histidine kinase CheA
MPSPELLRFFHAEASEYLDTLEDLLAVRSGDFEAGAFVAASRALRGSATMARVPRVAEIALVMERLGNAVRDGEVNWSGRLRADLADTIIDLRRFVTSGSREDDRDAAERLLSLRSFLPATRVTPSLTPTAGTTPIFIALQASAIAADLQNFLDSPGSQGLVNDIVNRLRSLRGIAGVADHPPLGEVADAIERTLRELPPDAVLREADTALLNAAASVFRFASSELRARGRFETTAPEVDRFARAAANTSPAPAARETPVVRVEELFYTDEGPHLIRRGTALTRTVEARFREEVVTRAEHLQRLVSEARMARDSFTRERVRRDLKGHLERLDEFARSYGAQQVASIVADAAVQESFDDAALDAIESLSQVLTTSGIELEEMESRLAVRERSRWTPASATPADLPATRQAGRPDTPSPRSGRALREMLDESLTKLASLDDMPLIEPVRVDDDAIVPVESLVYRGAAALERARTLRDELRTRGTTDPETLHELYDLLDLARAE